MNPSDFGMWISLIFLCFAFVLYYFAVKEVQKRFPIPHKQTLLCPPPEELIKLCNDISDFDLEAKIRVLQACFGHQCEFIVTGDSLNVSLRACGISGEDMSRIMLEDKSVG